MIKKLRLECVEVFRSNLFYLYLLRQVPINSFFKFALSPEFMILSCTSTYLLRTRVSPPSLCQAPYICLSFPTGFYIHQQSSTRVCLPSICQASNNSLSFPTRLYIHSDIFYVFVRRHSVRHPIFFCPSLLGCTYTTNLLRVFLYHRSVRHPIIHCPSLLSCTYTVIYTSARHQQQITLYCQAPYILLSFSTGLYIRPRQFFHTHPTNPYCNRKTKTTNKRINNNAHFQFEFYRIECRS
jgi:hypothetical protein